LCLCCAKIKVAANNGSIAHKYFDADLAAFFHEAELQAMEAAESEKVFYEEADEMSRAARANANAEVAATAASKETQPPTTYPTHRQRRVAMGNVEKVSRYLCWALKWGHNQLGLTLTRHDGKDWLPVAALALTLTSNRRDLGKFHTRYLTVGKNRQLIQPHCVQFQEPWYSELVNSLSDCFSDRVNRQSPQVHFG
jgi:hypothetical protein